MFSVRLREARQRAQTSQTKLAALAGCHRQSVTRWEQQSNTKPPDGDRLQRIAQALGTSVNWLLGIDDNRDNFVLTSKEAQAVRSSRSGSTNFLHLSRDEQIVVALMRDMSIEGCGLLIEYLRDQKKTLDDAMRWDKPQQGN